MQSKQSFSQSKKDKGLLFVDLYEIAPFVAMTEGIIYSERDMQSNHQ